MYRNGRLLQEAEQAKLNEQMFESDTRLQSLVASAQQLQVAFGGVAKRIGYIGIGKRNQ